MLVNSSVWSARSWLDEAGPVIPGISMSVNDHIRRNFVDCQRREGRIGAGHATSQPSPRLFLLRSNRAGVSATSGSSIDKRGKKPNPGNAFSTQSQALPPAVDNFKTTVAR